MFLEYKPIRGSLFLSRVNTFLGIVFLSTVALGATVFIMHATNGSDPITEGLGTVIANETQLP